MSKYVYSDSLEEMVLKEFEYKGKKYVWDDTDCIYYSEESDEEYFYEVPCNK